MYKLIESSNIPEDQQISISLEDRYENDFIKTASKRDLPKEVDEAIKNLKRKKDHSYMLVTAMGDGETWSDNKNHDYFPYDSLLGLQNTPVWNEVSPKDERLNNRIKAKLRYQTFSDAGWFHHHHNKPERGDQIYGEVPNAIWNPKMHTVLLIIGVDNKKDPETAEMIKRNQLVAVSMGAKLPWDRCSICHQHNTSIMKYCPHLKFQMGKILDDGRKIYAENLFPRFFDISKVNRPAFLAGMQLEKVASTDFEFSLDLADYYDIGQFDKEAEEIEKHSTIYKEMPTHIEGAIAKVCNTERDLPHKLMEELAKLKPSEAWGALTHAGIIAKPNEFAYILLKNSNRDDLAQEFYHTKAVIKNPDVKGLDEELHSLADIDITHKAVKLSNEIPTHILDERSIGCVGDRIYNTEKGLRKEAEITRTIGLGSILSALYLLYRNNAESKFSAYGLLGSGISQMIRDNKESDKYISNNPFTNEELNKQAAAVPGFWNSGKGLLTKGAIGFAAPYIASAHYQNKMQQGYPVGVLGRTIANNPGKMGIVGAAMGMAGAKNSYKAIKNVSNDLTTGVSKIFKDKK
jgi:hypothetical protein